MFTKEENLVIIMEVSEHVLKALLLNGLNRKLNIEWHHVLNDFENISYLLVERNQALNQFLQMHNRDIFVMY